MWHPVGFAAFVVVSLWVDSAVSPFAALRSLGVAVLFALVLWTVAGLATRSTATGALVASGVIGVLWAKTLVSSVMDLLVSRGAVAVLLLALVATSAVLAVRLVRRAGPFGGDRLTVLLNRASVLLVIASILAGFANGHLRAVGDDLDQGVGLVDWPAGRGDAAPDQPDIYAIMLDGYPRADVLDYAFGWDNAPFIDALAERGFDVASRSHSDYLWTHVSLPSALNLAYVEQIPAIGEVAAGQASRQPALRMAVSDNVAFAVARAHGYTVAAVGSGFEELAPRRADVYVDGGQINEFELTLLASTFAGDIVNVVDPDFAAAGQASRITGNLDAMTRIAELQDRDPALVFAHVPAPHQPAVLNEHGGIVPVPISTTFFADSPGERGENPDEYRNRYRAQLDFLNTRILGTIDAITESSRVPPVIVLFADHGSASEVDWTVQTAEDVDPARVLERTGTLFAALTPDRTDVYPDDVSPVDLFRLLYDAYLGTTYGRAVPPEDGGQIPPVDASVFDE